MRTSRPRCTHPPHTGRLTRVPLLTHAHVPQQREPDDPRQHVFDWTRDELHQAVEDQQFLLHYQPVVSLTTGELEGVEGLLRWEHPDHGTLAAGTFIDAMSKHLLLGPLLPQLINEACRTAVALADGDGDDPFVAFNVDPHQFAEDPIVDLIEASLTTTGAHAHSLVVEMTERHAAFDEDATMATARDLHNLGVQLAIDDFGTGHSTLTRLKALPTAKLKIDRSFVRDVVHDVEDQAIVASVVMLANSLGVGCVAEGVERSEQAEVLNDLGCPTGQGFLLGQPVTVAEITTFAGSAVA